uniref:Uncharacterized protein n=1 Tax=Trichobilharzia regenti TaxID=157069 RepID=A0AA85J009_TRIRE|nr:unnamed protein product [Trichobilharzia regenti]
MLHPLISPPINHTVYPKTGRVPVECKFKHYNGKQFKKLLNVTIRMITREKKKEDKVEQTNETKVTTFTVDKSHSNQWLFLLMILWLITLALSMWIIYELFIAFYHLNYHYTGCQYLIDQLRSGSLKPWLPGNEIPFNSSNITTPRIFHLLTLERGSTSENVFKTLGNTIKVFGEFTSIANHWRQLWLNDDRDKLIESSEMLVSFIKNSTKYMPVSIRRNEDISSGHGDSKGHKVKKSRKKKHRKHKETRKHKEIS